MVAVTRGGAIVVRRTPRNDEEQLEHAHSHKVRETQNLKNLRKKAGNRRCLPAFRSASSTLCTAVGCYCDSAALQNKVG